MSSRIIGEDANRRAPTVVLLQEENFFPVISLLFRF